MRVSLVALSLALAAPAAAQHQHMAMPIAAGDRLGDIVFPDSGNAAAQADFVSGVKHLHNFEYDGAAEAFVRAQKADPAMVMAYWGEAIAQNQTLWSYQDKDAALKALAKLAPTPAARAARAKTKREAMYLAAAEALYGSGTKAQRDAAFEARMAALVKAFPNDVEARVFDALAILGLTNGVRNEANYTRAGAMLEELFPAHPMHPGIVHYIIHSYDDPANAERGLAAARVYDKIAPDSPHAQHMTSHIFLARGMWPEVEAANVRAGEAAMRMWKVPKERLACGHGGIWLAYARLQQGKDVGPQLADCQAFSASFLEKRIKDGKTVPVTGGEDEMSAAVIRVTRGVENGQWAPRQSGIPDGKLRIARFTDDYGDVLAARHDPSRARAALASAEANLAASRAVFAQENPDDSVSMPWYELMLDEARAVTLLAEGRQVEGMVALSKVARAERSLPPVFGPPVLIKPSWELLGDEQLAAGNKEAAAAAYRQSLALQPNRRLSVAGLKATGGQASGAQNQQLSPNR